MIYTFYSYKGGVGRTMALANLAELFYRAGNRVLMIDWDLEAPGLEQFFFPPEKLAGVQQERGVIDLVLDYKEKMKQDLQLSDPEKLPFEHPRKAAVPIYHREDRNAEEQPTSSGQLWLITPGQRLNRMEGSYAQVVLNFNWVDFYANWAGEVYIDWFRRQCKDFADVILIDSRTGVTEMGGVCTYHLADVVVLLCAANNQNLQGTQTMLRNLSQADPAAGPVEEHALFQQRGGRPLKTLVVPARIDLDNPDALGQFRQNFRSLGGRSADQLEDLLIPYVSRYASQERLVVGRETDSDALVKAYDRLYDALGEKGEQLRDAWKNSIAILLREIDEQDAKNSDLRVKKTLSVEAEEKDRLQQQIDKIAAQRDQLEQQRQQLQQEMRYYRIQR